MPIHTVNLLQEKLTLARELGATQLFSSASPEVGEEVKEATSGDVDIAVEMASSTKAFDLA